MLFWETLRLLPFSWKSQCQEALRIKKSVQLAVRTDRRPPSLLERSLMNISHIYFGRHWTRPTWNEKTHEQDVWSLSILSVLTRWDLPDISGGIQAASSCEMMSCSPAGHHVLCSHSWPAYPWDWSWTPKRVLGPYNCPWIPIRLNKIEKLRTGTAVQVSCSFSSHSRTSQ